MNIHTLLFGELEITDKDVVTFTQGIPGFEELTQYTIIQPDENMPFVYFQSLEIGKLCLLATNPFLFVKEYDFQLSESDQEDLQIESPEDVVVWTVVTVNEDYTKITVNLLAPIIVNHRSRSAKQIILHDTEYKVKHEIVLQDVWENDQTKG